MAEPTVKKEPGITSVSLKNMINGSGGGPRNSERKKSSEDAPQEPDFLNQPVTIEKLQVAWKKYVEGIKKENVRLFSILDSQIPELKDHTTILLKLTSSVQEVEILKYREQLILFLKSEFKNHSLVLETTIAETEGSAPQMIYTASDKMQAMMEKNPALALLKQQLNLELD